MRKIFGATILLCFFTLKLQAQADSLQAQQYVMRATLYGIGHTNILDTYLSPMEYTGPEFRIQRENMRMTNLSNGNISRQSLFQANVSMTNNHAGTSSEFTFLANWALAYHYQYRINEQLKLLAGPYFDLNGGMIYNFRNSNNPVQAKAYANIGASGMAIYHLRIKEIPFQFFKTWEETADQVDKKNINDMLGPFFAKNENMGLYFNNVVFPIYEDYKPDYWNDSLRWIFGQPPKSLDLAKAAKARKSTKKGTVKADKKSETNQEEISYPKPNIEIYVPKNGNELVFMDKKSLLTPQLQDEMGSGQVIEIKSTLEERIVELAIGYNRDLNRWLIIHYNDNKAPEKEKKKPKEKTKSKSKAKKK